MVFFTTLIVKKNRVIVANRFTKSGNSVSLPVFDLLNNLNLVHIIETRKV